MISDKDEALTIFNEITGLNDLSSSFRKTLVELNLTEIDGYIIKLKLNDEILSGKLTSDHVVDRLNFILNKLSNEKSCENHVYNNPRDILLFLNNQEEDNKVVCSECNQLLLSIDQYCSNCGSKCTPKLDIFDLLSSINDSYIKPGDIIRVNMDHSIEKTTFEENQIFKENMMGAVNLESLYDTQIKRNNLNKLFSEVLVLDHVQKQGNISIIDAICFRYDVDDSYMLVNNLINNGLLEFKVNDTIYNKFRDVLAVLDIRTNKISSDSSVNHYFLTRSGEKFLEENSYVLLFDKYFKNSVADDIVLFDELYSNNKCSLDELVGLFINVKRLEFMENNQLVEYLSTFDLEAYIYESMDLFDKWIQTLFKKFIISLNENYSSKSLKPLDAEFCNYLVNVLKKESLSLSNLKSYFFKSYDDLDGTSFIHDKETCFNYLLRCFNGEDVSNMNFELYGLYDDK